jgi:hypothetical protein
VDPDQITGSRFNLNKGGGAACPERKADLLILVPKVAPSLQRADLSFMNSVTGSGCIVKCSNILQDIFF